MLGDSAKSRNLKPKLIVEKTLVLRCTCRTSASSNNNKCQKGPMKLKALRVTDPFPWIYIAKNYLFQQKTASLLSVVTEPKNQSLGTWGTTRAWKQYWKRGISWRTIIQCSRLTAPSWFCSQDIGKILSLSSMRLENSLRGIS